jgi:hypothetical protein
VCLDLIIPFCSFFCEISSRIKLKQVDSYPVFTRHKSVQRHGLSAVCYQNCATVLPRATPRLICLLSKSTQRLPPWRPLARCAYASGGNTRCNQDQFLLEKQQSLLVIVLEAVVRPLKLNLVLLFDHHLNSAR